MMLSDLFGADPTVLISLTGGGPLARITRWLQMPLVRARAARRLTERGAAAVEAYAIGPDLEHPMWIYPLHTAAGAYAERHLVPAPDRHYWIRAVITWWIGCDPAAAAVVLVGRSS